MASMTSTQDSFFLTLPSNSSMIDFPDNTLTHFKVKLPHTIHLEGEYECGLVDIHYPRSWYNLLCTEEHPCRSIVKYKQEGEIYKKNITAGYYGTIGELVRAVTPQANRMPYAEACRMEVMGRVEKIKFDVMDGFEIILDGPITRMLGFDSNHEVIYGEKAAPLSYIVDPISQLFVYSDILSHEIIGDTRAPLLRVVNVGDSHGTNAFASYDNPHYKRVQTKVFDTIEILITDSNGKPIPFIRGNVILTLQLKKKAPAYL